MSTDIRRQFFTDMLAVTPQACRLWGRWHTSSDTNPDADADMCVGHASALRVDVYADGHLHGTHILTRRLLEQGWHQLVKLYQAGRWDHCGGDTLPTVTDINTAIDNNDENSADTDACIVDGAVQCALFGEVRYG